MDAIAALERLTKAGPYIGPKGGKWADAAHTIPWKEEGSTEGSKKKRTRKSNLDFVQEAIKIQGYLPVEGPGGTTLHVQKVIGVAPNGAWIISHLSPSLSRHLRIKRSAQGYLAKRAKEIIAKKEEIIEERERSRRSFLERSGDAIDALEPLCKKQQHPVSEQQRRWAFAAEERGELPKGTARKWSRRVKGEDLPGRTGKMVDKQMQGPTLVAKRTLRERTAHEAPPKEHREGGATEKKHYADPEAYKYPIDDEKHVRAAISYFSKPKNANMYPPEKRRSIWSRIRSAAKRFGIAVGEESGPPSLEAKQTSTPQRTQLRPLGPPRAAPEGPPVVHPTGGASKRFGAAPPAKTRPRVEPLSPGPGAVKKLKSEDAIDALEALSKAGPYIGPKGGKWADAKHTIPWKGGKAKGKLDWKHEGGRSTVHTPHGSYRVSPSETESGKHVVSYEPTTAGREHPFRETHSSKEGARGRAQMHHAGAKEPVKLKSLDAIDMLKGLWTFEENKKDPHAALPDAMLYDYLCAFIEEALEHEKREHKRDVNVGDPDRWWAQRVFHELVATMPKSKNLMRAGKGQTVDSVLAIMRSKNLVLPDHPTADPQSGAGEKMAYSLRVPWLQADPTASMGLTLRSPETVRPNGGASQALALRCGPQVVYRDEPVAARIDPACNVHGYADLTKSQNLRAPYSPCTCGGPA